MKKIELKIGLTFNKEAISKLNEDQLSIVKGGRVRRSIGPDCSCRHNTCGGGGGDGLQGQP